MSLDCYFCGREFTDFYPLAKHVQRVHVNGMFDEEVDMLPGVGGSQAPARSKRGSGLSFLSNEMLSKQPKEAKILMVRNDPENKFGSSIVLKLALEGNTVLWTVRLKNPNFAELVRKFGQDENDWCGQKILIALTQDEFSESWFPHVSFPTKK